jgi:hypothetical protein
MPRAGWDQRSPAFDLDDRTFCRTIHQTSSAPGVRTFVDVDLYAVQWLQRHIDSVDIDLAADDVAHPALSAAFVIDLQSGHAGFL